MRLTALWLAFSLIPAMTAATVACAAGAASIPIFDPSSTSGAVGDYTLDCTGGMPTPPTDPTPTVDITAFINAPILKTGGWIVTDGVNNTPGTLAASNEIQFLGVPFNPPGAGNLDLEIENIFVNPSAEAPGFRFEEIDALNGDFSIMVSNEEQEVGLNAVPEPSLVLLLLGGALGLVWRGRDDSRLRSDTRN